MKRTKSPETPHADTAVHPFPLASSLLLVSVFYMTFTARIIPSPLLLTIEKDLGITHAEGGAFFLILSLGLMTSMLLSGFLLRKIQLHTAISLSAGVTALALFLLAASRDLFPFRLGLFLVGAGSGLYLPSGIVTITELVPVNKRGMGIAVHEMGPIFGLATAPFLAEIALRTSGWRHFLFILGAVSLAVGLVYARFGEGGRFHGTPPHWRELSRIVKKRDFWIIAFLFIMGIGHEVGIYSMLPAFLVEARGINQSMVNSMVSTSRLTSLLMIFIAGWLADRFGYRRVIVAITLACGIVTAFIGFSEGFLLVAAVYLQPMLVSAFFPAGFIALAGVSSSRERNLPVSLIISIGHVFGGGMIPALIGRLAVHGAFGTGFVLAGIGMAAGAFLVPLMEKQPGK